MRSIIFTLLDSIECDPITVTLEEFDEYFQIGRDIPERMVGFLSKLGPKSYTVKILSVCNQAATAAAVIELKTTLGFSNATTDMANTWHFDIIISDTSITVLNTKREQMHRVFEFEWQFTTQFSRTLECTSVTLLVTDLVFSQGIAPAQMHDVCQRLDHLMTANLREDLNKSRCFPSTSAAGSVQSTESNDSLYLKSGFLRKVGGARKKPGNWQRRWLGLGDDGCLYYFKNAPGKKKIRPSGCIDLKEVIQLNHADDVTKKMNSWSVEIPLRTYYFQSTTFEDAQSWIASLARFTAPSAVPAATPVTQQPMLDKSAKRGKQKKRGGTWSKALGGLSRRTRSNTGFFEEHSSLYTECLDSTGDDPLSPRSVKIESEALSSPLASPSPTVSISTSHSPFHPPAPSPPLPPSSLSSSSSTPSSSSSSTCSSSSSSSSFSSSTTPTVAFANDLPEKSNNHVSLMIPDWGETDTKHSLPQEPSPRALSRLNKKNPTSASLKLSDEITTGNKNKPSRSKYNTLDREHFASSSSSSGRSKGSPPTSSPLFDRPRTASHSPLPSPRISAEIRSLEAEDEIQLLKAKNLDLQQQLSASLALNEELQNQVLLLTSQLQLLQSASST